MLALAIAGSAASASAPGSRAVAPAPHVGSAGGGGGGGGVEPSREAMLRAAFIYNFAKFVDWPDGALADSTLVIGVIGADPLGAALDSLAGMPARERVVRVARPDGIVGAAACHVLCVGAMEPARRDALLRALRDRPVLTVGEGDGFADRGGMIELLRHENRLRFRVNLTRAEAAKLRLSVQLLRLAESVITAEQEAEGPHAPLP